jgi:hypothetical protein
LQLLDLGIVPQLDELRIRRRLSRRRLARIVEVGLDRLEVDQLHQLLGRIVEVLRRDQIGEPAGERLLLQVDHRHQAAEPLALPAGPQPDIDGHVVARFPVARIDGDPLLPQAHGLGLAAMLADGGMQ